MTSGERPRDPDRDAEAPADSAPDIGQVDTLDASGTVTPDAFLAEVGRIPARTSLPAQGPALRPGDMLGRFVVRSELGRGGMGVVYAADDRTLGREVALKVLPSSDEEEPRRRFLREARAAAAITDPGIATIYDVGEDGGHIFIAMELVRGRTLRAALDARGSDDRALPIGEALRVAREITRALATAHARGVVHRDLKPENAMIAEDGHLKLLDFGIAKHTASGIYDSTAGTSSSEIGRILGTPSYMSPEQAKGRVVDARSDVFSLGVMLFEMVTGRRPFDRATLVEMFIALDRDEPPAPSRLNPRVPAALERVILRCLRKDPAARYADARALLHELETISVTRPPGRARVFVAAAAAVLAMGVVALAASRSPAPPAATAATTAPPAESAAIVATPVTGLPMPASTSAEALAAYREGVVSSRSGEQRGSPFERAIELDPTLAAAHLRLAADAMAEARPSQREHFRKADEGRAALTERDRGLLDALEPMVRRQPADWAEANGRIHALLERFPGDAELWFLLGNGTVNHTDFDAGARYYTRATELDPQFARAFSARAMAEAYLGRFDDARRSVDRCLAVSPSSGACLGMLARLQSDAGDCEGMEGTARRMIAGGSQPGWAYVELAEALASRGQPISTVREALRQSAQAIEANKGMTDEDRSCHLVSSTWATELLAGELDAAERSAHAYEKLVAGKIRQDEHATAALGLAELLEEEGRDKEAARVALEFLDRRDAWEPNPGAEDVAMAHDATPSLLAVARRGGLLTRAQVAARRAPWLKAWSARVTPVARNFLWPHAWARGVDSAEEAREALAAQPRGETLPPFSPVSLLPADIGHTFLLGGRVDEAIPWLEHATRTCDVLSHPVDHTRADLWLGQAREARADTPGACAAYQTVIQRWGKARPKSVTADRARERIKALRCGA